MPEPLKLIHQDATLVLGESGPLLLAVWWDAPTASQMDVVGRAASASRRRFQQQTAFAQFVIGGTPRFSTEVRRKAAEQTQAHAGLASAHVIEIEGLAGSAARAFLSALMLITQRDNPVRVFSGPEKAAAWLAERLRDTSGDWSPKSILDLRQQAYAARP